MQPKLDDIFTHKFSFTKEQAMLFAHLSGDANPIHIDEQYAEQSMFGKCIIHGYFSISIFSKVYGTLLYPDGHILVSQSAKYIQPIFSGVDYVAVFTVKEIFPEKNRVRYRNEIFDKAAGELKITGEAVLMNKKHYKW